jgi:hypothetical protein
MAWDSLHVLEDGRIIRSEMFELDQTDVLRARMTELRAHS